MIKSNDQENNNELIKKWYEIKKNCLLQYCNNGLCIEKKLPTYHETESIIKV